jgi:hypothetical protein
VPGLWLSYLFVLFYIGIAAGAVTHKDLLLENPVKLPFLNVELPLVAFFVLAPIIVSHAYTLMHFVMLAAKVGAFDKELRAQLGDAPETREGLRRQLPSNIFVQFLAGPGDIRKRSWVAFEGSRLDHSRLVDCQRATSGHLARRCAASGRGFSKIDACWHEYE